MRLLYIRIFFVILSVLVCFQLFTALKLFDSMSGILGAACGLVGSLLIIFLELRVRRVSVRGLSASVFGLIFGLIMAKLLSDAFGLIPLEPSVGAAVKLGFVLIFSYLGMVIAMRGRDEFNIIIPYVRFSKQEQRQDIILLDTSVIIDGRIADICQTKFIEGRFVVPRFVLKELQLIADSADSLKRSRGRRGLDILNRMQKLSNTDVKIEEDDFPDLSGVDAKLVKLARVLGAKVLTNDYNLNKVAELEGVSVLNLNDLANALKPVVLPGEEMEVRIIKEGKEHNQGVAYLDDGTMVVVEHGRHLIGQTKTVTITSVLQTSAGRMIFAKTGDR
ncbi:MAG: PIN domain-containing protein [Candidatus Omnitrophota bacterium]